MSKHRVFTFVSCSVIMIVLGLTVMLWFSHGWNATLFGANQRVFFSSNDHENFEKIRPDKFPETRSSTSEYYFDRYPYASLSQPIHRQSTSLLYSETVFRNSTFPILWLDSHGEVRWNEASERRMYAYLLDKQFPQFNVGNLTPVERDQNNINSCLNRQLMVIDQHKWGFFSRVHCFIEQFGQALFSPEMAVLSPRQFEVSNAGQDDYLEEGILRYFAPISICSSYMRHAQMAHVDRRIRNIAKGKWEKYLLVKKIQHLLPKNHLKADYDFVLMRDVWKFGYQHVPHRRWLFDQEQIKNDYNLSIQTLTDHSKEHIYIHPNFLLANWTERNKPWADPDVHLTGVNVLLTTKDRIFMSFLRYMFVLFFSRLAPRIQIFTRLLREHWSNYLSDKLRVPHDKTLNRLAGLFIRRGDKMPEDNFWQKHGYWRNISLYVKGIVDEEHRRQYKFTAIYVMTDDASVMNSFQSFSAGKSTGIDELYARKHLRGRQILYNVFAPQACFNPFERIGFDQFLVSLNFLVQYAAFIVGHSDSNVGRYLEEIMYSRAQINTSTQSTSFVKNAPDSL